MNNPPYAENDPASLAHSSPWQIGLGFFTIFLLGNNDGAMSILIPILRTHYHLDTAIIGQVFLFNTAGYLITALSHGLLAKHVGQRSVLLIGVTSYLMGVGLMSLIPPFIVVLLLQGLQGFGGAIIDVHFNAMLAQMPRRAILLSHLHAIHGIGALLGPLMALAFIASDGKWNWIYILWTVMGLVVLAGLLTIFKHGGIMLQEARDKHNGNPSPASLKTKMIVTAIIFFFLFVGVEFSLGSWSYSFLTEERLGDPFLMGWAVSGYYLSETVGRLTLARRLQQLGEQRMVLICLGGGLVGLLMMWLIPQITFAPLGLCLTGFCFGPIAANAMTFLSQRVPSYLLLSTIGLLLCFGTIGNALFSWQAGNLAHSLGFWSLLPYEIIFTSAAICCWIILLAQSR